jgi:3-hydroxy-9,10-secoandrosta-1,3,5(10)-triene-9,17-dione monooxygenase reductase component
VDRILAHKQPIDLVIDGKSGIDPQGSEDARRSFRDTLGHFCTGVTAITALGPQSEDWVGITVSSFNSLSLDPPLILWSLARDSLSFGCFQPGSPFAVNVFSADQEKLAIQFAQPYMQREGRAKFAGVPVHMGLDGVPLIQGCVVYLECETHARYPGGDHDIIVGRVRRIYNIGKAPLLFHAGAFKPLAGI